MNAKMTTTLETQDETLAVKPKVPPKPCLEFNKEEGITYKYLHYAIVNSTIEELKEDIRVCATFPSRRAIFVAEMTGKSAGVIVARDIEFYEFTPEQGWKFKKLYTVSYL